MHNFSQTLHERTDFSPEIIQKLSDFNDMVYIKNDVMNLTRIPKEISVYRNFLDSLNPIVLREMHHAKNVIDIGSGAGFPAIALAICFADIHFVLVEATRKKADFLNETCAALGLKNTQIVVARAEELAHDKNHRERYDIVTARAVANLLVLCELTSGFAKKGGKLLLYKGADAELEMVQAKTMLQKLKLNKADITHYSLLDDTDDMNMVMINKFDHVSTIYPRRYSIIKNSINK